MRRTVIAMLSTVLVAAGCGGGNSGSDSDGKSQSFEGVSVSSGKVPKVTGAKDLKASKTKTKVLKAGGGDEVEKGDTVKLDFVAVNGRTGKQFDNTYASGKTGTFTMSGQSVMPGFSKAIVGEKVGSRILAIVAPEDGIGQANAQFDLRASDSLIFVFDVVGKVPQQAEGKSKALPSTLPKLRTDGDSKPTKFVKQSSTAKNVRKPSAHVVVKGKGEKVKLNQNISVQYLGQTYPAGDIFDTSWNRAPANFQLAEGQLIACWTDLLPGQRVGSRVVLVCPSDVAYGKQGSPPKIKPNSDLIFAIDILDAA